MTTPVSGPILRNYSTVDATGFCDYMRSAQIYRQRVPYNMVLTYRANSCSAKWHGDSPMFDAKGFDVTGGSDGSYHQSLALAQARERLRASISDSAALGVDLAEYHQAVSMITKRAKQLALVVRGLRRGNFKGAISMLGIRFETQKFKDFTARAKFRSFANNFLELHFGWVPLFQDLYDAAQVISEPIKATRVMGKGFSAWPYDYESYSTNPWDGSQNYSKTHARYTVQVKVGAAVTVSNPNLYLARNLGLTNPLSIAWELVPFSFVVDWFANVGQFVSQLDDFAGLALSQAYTTTFFRSTAYQTTLNASVKPNIVRYSQGSGWNCSRDPGVAGVSLVMKPLALPSATRALTAVSLALQRLRG